MILLGFDYFKVTVLLHNIKLVLYIGFECRAHPRGKVGGGDVKGGS